MPPTKTNNTKAIHNLSKQVSRVATALERQNSARRRFLMGLVFGVGTAIGASIIASAIIIFMVRAFSLIGFDASQFGQDIGSTIEGQLKLQSPQD